MKNRIDFKGTLRNNPSPSPLRTKQTKQVASDFKRLSQDHSKTYERGLKFLRDNNEKKIRNKDIQQIIEGKKTIQDIILKIVLARNIKNPGSSDLAFIKGKKKLNNVTLPSINQK